MKKRLCLVMLAASALFAMAAGTKVWVYSHSGNHQSIDIADFDSLSFVEPGFLEVSPVEKKIGKEGGRFTLDITANKPWTASSNDPAVILGTTQGTGNAKIACTAMPNTEEEPYTAIITVTLEDGTYKQALVTVGQLKPTGITINDMTCTLFDAKTLPYTITPADVSIKQFTLTSSDTSVATVDPDGTVHGIKEGTAKITAKCGDLSSSCTVTVKKVAVASVTLSQTEARLYKIGETLQLTATVKPDDASYPEVTWTSSDASVVSVDQNGKLTAKKYPAKNEPVIITATADNVTATCMVTLWPQQSETITLSETSHTFTKGDGEFTLSIKDIHPAERTLFDQFRWYTDDANVANINGDTFVEGNNIYSVTIKCKDVGTTKIHCLDLWSGVEAVCVVAMAGVPVQNISFNNESDLIAFSGKSYSLPKVTVTPSNATLAGDVEYSVSDAAVNVTVGNTNVSYAIPSGLSEVKTYTVTAKCGGKSASFVMYGVPTNYLNTVMLQSSYSEYGVFGMGGVELKPTQLLQDSYSKSTVASKVKMRYSSESGSATRAIVETSTYTVGSDYDSYKYDYNIHAEGGTSFNRSIIVFRLVLSDMTGSKQLSQTINVNFYNSLLKYTYETVQKVYGNIKTVTGDITTTSTLNLNIVRDASAQKIYCPAMTIYAEYYKDSSKSSTGTYKAAYSARSDVPGYSDVTRTMSVYSSDATKSQTGTHDFTIKFKK